MSYPPPDLYAAGQIGSLLGVNVLVDRRGTLPRGQMLYSPWGVLVSPDGYWRAWGRYQWQRRLHGHPAEWWVCHGEMPASRLIDRLLPGWRTR